MAMSFIRKFHQSLARLIHHETRILRRFSNSQHGQETSASSFTNRTHLCGDLRPNDVGKSVLLCGWLQYHRLSGAFMILRDWKGLVQLILPQDKIDHFKSLPHESVLQVKGEVILRPPGQENKSMATGDIEVAVDDIQVLNTCSPTLPFQVRNFYQVKESLRIKHRYLDLRLANVQTNLRVRSKFIMAVRDFLINHNEFVEVETPTLFRRTPGGAREFLVPTHLPGKFYCLPQSPQQFKQLLMVGGLDRYFQVAKCYRDEGSRPDRQPEFTQLDLEMSFVTKEDILSVVERILEEAWPEDKGCVQGPFPRMSYQSAMSLYGVDKPDTRFDWQIQDITEVMKSTYIPPVFQPMMEKGDGASIQVIRIPKACKHVSNKDIEAVKQKVTELLHGRVKLVSCKIKEETDWGSGFGRHLEMSSKQRIATIALGVVEPSDLILFACGTGFQPVRGLHFDLVLNGAEIGGGSIRVHDSAMQRYIIDDILKEDSSQLAHLLEALDSGCPPHGGIALGLDRLMAIMCGANSIRDVIAFPKTTDGKDPLSNAPSAVSPSELDYYHIKLSPKNE